MFPRITIIALTFGLLAACQARPYDTARDVDALKADQAKWRDDIQHRDATAYAAHYAADGVLYDAGQPPVPGRTAMQAMMTGAFKDPGLKMVQTPDRFDVSSDGSMGYVQGKFSETYSDPQGKGAHTQSGYFVTVYRKQADGSWKVVQDIATPSPGV